MIPRAQQAQPELPLRDIHVSPLPEWWPPAPGWWIVALVSLAALAYCVWLLMRQWRIRQRRRFVLSELEAIHRRWNQHGRDEKLLAELSEFLRRLGLALGGRSLAGVTGSQWLEDLEELAEHPGVLTGSHKAALIDGPYQPASKHDADAAYRSVHAFTERVAARIARLPHGGA